MNPYFATRFGFMCGLGAPSFMIFHVLTDRTLTAGDLRASVVIWCVLGAGWATAAFLHRLRLEQLEDNDE